MSTEKNTTKKKKIEDMLIEKILSGELKPGSQLPPERDLAEAAGISRGSVNQAILNLERMGLVKIVPRKGNFVTDFMPDATPDTLAKVINYNADSFDFAFFSDLMDMRKLMECECARLAAKKMTDERRYELNILLKEIKNASEEEIPTLFFQYHKLVVTFSDNKIYLSIFNSLRKLIRAVMEARYANYDDTKFKLSNLIPKYAALNDAICTGDPELASTLQREILNITYREEE